MKSRLTYLRGSNQRMVEQTIVLREDIIRDKALIDTLQMEVDSAKRDKQAIRVQQKLVMRAAYKNIDRMIAC